MHPNFSLSVVFIPRFVVESIKELKGVSFSLSWLWGLATLE
jgi:hypothetical protein